MRTLRRSDTGSGPWRSGPSGTGKSGCGTSGNCNPGSRTWGGGTSGRPVSGSYTLGCGTSGAPVPGSRDSRRGIRGLAGACGEAAGRGLLRSAHTVLLSLTLAAMMAALLLLPGCVVTEGSYKYKGTEVTTETVDLGGIEVVEFVLGSEDLVVNTSEVSRAEFIIEKTYRANEEEYGKELLREAEILFDRRGDRLVVERKKDKDMGITKLSKGYVSIDIEVGLPAGLRLEITAGSGDLEIGDRGAPVKAHTGSGDVRVAEASAGLEVDTGSGDMVIDAARQEVALSAGSGDIVVGGAGGDVSVQTGSGDVVVRKSSGDLSVSTGSGDVEVNNSTGSVKAETGSGDVEVTRHTGSADLSTASGDVELGIEGGAGQIAIVTSSGEVDVVVYAADSYEVDIETDSGSISSQIPLTVKEASRGRLSGHYGTGGFSLTISTSSGGVSIVRGAI